MNWNTELENPPKRKESERYQRMKFLSNNWITCAVGKQCSVIPRKNSGEPKDSELFYLGTLFAEHIGQTNWEGAKTVLIKIENRSAEIIREIEYAAKEKQ